MDGLNRGYEAAAINLLKDVALRSSSKRVDHPLFLVRR
jgi:hypothetical protein